MPAADLAARMLRERQAARTRPPVTLTTPPAIINARQRLLLGIVDRETVQKAFGTAFPHAGWHGYAVIEQAARAERRDLFVLYDEGGKVRAIELREAGPQSPLKRLEPREYGAFRILPGAVGIGDRFERLDEAYVVARDEADFPGHDEQYAARFTGGRSAVSGSLARIARIAIYAEGVARLP